jgi:hypothetical protein
MAKKIEVALTLDNSKFNRNLKTSETRVDQFSKNSTASISKVGAAFAALGGAALLKNIVTIGQTFQDLRTSLAAVTGSAEDGKAAFDNLTTLATQTQFGVEELVQSFIRLKSAGVEPTNDLLLTFSNTAATAQDQVGVLNSLTELFARATSKAKLELEDFNKIEERGVSILGILRKEFNLNIKEIQELAKTAQGQEKLFAGITNALDKAYGKNLEIKLKNSSIAFSNLGIALRSLADATFTELGLDDTTAITALTNAVNDLAKNTEGLGKLLDTLGNIIYAVGGAFLFLKTSSRDLLAPVLKVVDKTKGAFVGFITQLKDLKFAFDLTRTSIASYGVISGGTAVATATLGTAVGGLVLTIGSLVLALDGIISLITGEGLIPWRKLGEAIGLVGKEGKDAAVALSEFKTLGKDIQDGGITEQLFLQREAAKMLKEEIARVTEEYNELTDNDTLFDMETQEPIDKLKAFGEEIDKSLGGIDEYNRLMKLFNGMFSDPKTIADMEQRESALKDLKDSYSSLFDPLDKLNEAIRDGVEDSAEQLTLQAELNRLRELGIYTTDELAEAQRNLDEAFNENTGLLAFIDTLNTATDTLADDLAVSLMEGKNVLDDFKNFFKTLVQQIIADAIKMLFIIPILEAIGFSVPGGSITGLSGSGLLGSLGFKQTGIGGGNLMPNRPVLVGESGSEVFYPSTSGTLVPNGQATNVTYNIQALDPRSFKEILSQDPSFVYAVTRAGARKLPGVV